MIYWVTSPPRSQYTSPNTCHQEMLWRSFYKVSRDCPCVWDCLLLVAMHMGLISISNRNSLSNNDLANWDTLFVAPSLDELPLVIDAFFATHKMVDFYYNMICFHKRVRLNMLWGPKFRDPFGPEMDQHPANQNGIDVLQSAILWFLFFLMMGGVPQFSDIPWIYPPN